MKKRKKRSLFAAVVSLVISIIFIVVGVYAYVNNYSVMLFGVIPLNWVGFAIIAVVLLTWSVWDTVWAIKERRPVEDESTVDSQE
ncbi:MAG: hypothetical protein FWF30_05035 [Coriobacteriia bacterium]|nr:hypothetical protein [Coriobacteriia bacterium]